MRNLNNYAAYLRENRRLTKIRTKAMDEFDKLLVSNEKTMADEIVETNFSYWRKFRDSEAFKDYEKLTAMGGGFLFTKSLVENPLC